MGKFFSDAVETALQYIYYDVRTGKGAEGLELLQKASADGDGDATCILARCYGGRQFVWSGHNFPEDDDLCIKYIHKSVEQGSALGVLVAMRLGELTAALKYKMPFTNLQEAFQVVLQKAEAGEPFCQYTIGNVYFWMDFLDIDGKDENSFNSKEEFWKYVLGNMMKCEDWFWKALKGGVGSAVNNLRRLYETGNDGLIPPRPEKIKEVFRAAAEGGNPNNQWSYANLIEQNGKGTAVEKEAFHWYEQAALGGQFECWYIVGNAYLEGKIVKGDLNHALQCYEKALQQTANTTQKIACANKLGWLYCDGVSGIPKNRDRAFTLLQLAVDNGETQHIGWLGKCYFGGFGTIRDYVKARECFEQAKYFDEEIFYMLGTIYAQGLGCKADIAKGMSNLKLAGNLPEAKAERAKYKKPLFGQWMRKE